MWAVFIIDFWSGGEYKYEVFVFIGDVFGKIGYFV